MVQFWWEFNKEVTMLDFQQTTISKLFDEKKGSAMVEYAILLALIAIIAVSFATEFVMD